MPEKTVTFAYPFTLPGMEHPHCAGTFELRQESESLDVAWPAYHVTTTLILPTAEGYEAWPISADELDRLLIRDKAESKS